MIMNLSSLREMKALLLHIKATTTSWPALGLNNDEELHEACDGIWSTCQAIWDAMDMLLPEDENHLSECTKIDIVSFVECYFLASLISLLVTWLNIMRY